jgi:hypothetical protein
MGQTAGIYKILVRKPYIKKHLERSRHSGGENIKPNFQEIEWKAMLQVT